MDWSTDYWISRSVTVQFDGAQVRMTDSVSRPLQELSLDGIQVLLAFAGGATPEAAYEVLSRTFDTDRDGFETVVAKLESHGVLVTGQKATAPPDGGFASLRPHHVMLRDAIRVLAYREAIMRHVQGLDVIEVGAGTGILSLFAGKAGARRVAAIEETTVWRLAHAMVDANRLSDVVTVWNGNSRNFLPNWQADVLIHEIIGSDPLDEGILNFIEDARVRLLKPGGRLIPWRLEVLAVGFEAQTAPTEDQAGREAEARHFQSIYGVDFGPYLAYATARSEAARNRPLEPWPESTLSERVLTAECALYDLNLYQAVDQLPDVPIQIKVTRAGRLDGALVFFRAHLDETTVLTNSPYLPVTSWGRYAFGFSEPRRVAPGQTLDATARSGLTQGRRNVWIELGKTE